MERKAKYGIEIQVSSSSSFLSLHRKEKRRKQNRRAFIFLTIRSKFRMKSFSASSSKTSMKFRMPTRENLVPINLDIELDGQNYKDSFTWNPDDPDSEVSIFAKRTVKDLKLPSAFINLISQSIQSQLADFRSYGGHEMFIKEKIIPISVDLRENNTVLRDNFLWDISNFESDPEEFAKILCDDLNIKDPELPPAIAVAIREQLYEIATQSVSNIREAKLGKKVRKGYDLSKAGKNALDVTNYFGTKGSVIRKKKDYYMYEPTVNVLSNEEIVALDAVQL